MLNKKGWHPLSWVSLPTGFVLIALGLIPFLNSLGSFWFVVAVGFFVSLLIVLVYKVTTDQKLMKSLKEFVRL